MTKVSQSRQTEKGRGGGRPMARRLHVGSGKHCIGVAELSGSGQAAEGSQQTKASKHHANSSKAI